MSKSWRRFFLRIQFLGYSIDPWSWIGTFWSYFQSLLQNWYKRFNFSRQLLPLKSILYALFNLICLLKYLASSGKELFILLLKNYENSNFILRLYIFNVRWKPEDTSQGSWIRKDTWQINSIFLNSIFWRIWTIHTVYYSAQVLMSLYILS